MTTEIERKFFDAFGIKQECYDTTFKLCTGLGCIKGRCALCRWYHYPTIADRILLELICILNPYAPAVGDNVESLKAHILHYCVEYKDKIYNEVRTLFGLKEQQ